MPRPPIAPPASSSAALTSAPTIQTPNVLLLLLPPRDWVLSPEPLALPPAHRDSYARAKTPCAFHSAALQNRFCVPNCAVDVGTRVWRRPPPTAQTASKSGGPTCSTLRCGRPTTAPNHRPPPPVTLQQFARRWRRRLRVFNLASSRPPLPSQLRSKCAQSRPQAGPPRRCCLLLPPTPMEMCQILIPPK